ncbi:MAG: hypothetical protein F6K30_25975 [Cyanothece sp. SIO2G6]|nr:hypothetical protein [Cyanothece sp. SIO2G6]
MAAELLYHPPKAIALTSLPKAIALLPTKLIVLQHSFHKKAIALHLRKAIASNIHPIETRSPSHPINAIALHFKGAIASINSQACINHTLLQMLIIVLLSWL